MLTSVGIALYCTTAFYVLFCACSTRKQYRFYILALLSLALDVPFVALEMRINGMHGVLPRVVYLLHLIAMGVQFQQLAGIMHHHLFVYRRILTSELYAPHGKRAQFLKGVAAGSSTVYFLMLVLHLVVAPTQALEIAFYSSVFLPTLVALVALMSTMLSLCFLNYVRMVHRILNKLGETQRDSKQRMQRAAVVCCLVFALKTISIVVINYTELQLPIDAWTAVYHWIPMLVPTLALAHVHRVNVQSDAAARAEVAEFGETSWGEANIEL